MDLFKPVKDQVDQEWAGVAELMTLCDKGVNMDAESALGFSVWPGRLSDADEQKRAKAYLSLVELDSPIMAHIVGELIKLFRPEDGSWTELHLAKDILDRVLLDAGFEFDML
jgi:hypothetical protein